MRPEEITQFLLDCFTVKERSNAYIAGEFAEHPTPGLMTGSAGPLATIARVAAASATPNPEAVEQAYFDRPNAFGLLASYFCRLTASTNVMF